MSTFKRQTDPVELGFGLSATRELSNSSAGDSAGRLQTTCWGFGFVLVRNRLPSSRLALHDSNLYPLKQVPSHLE
jgi:hypothetical protein